MTDKSDTSAGIQIDEQAPILLHGEIEVLADADTVWDVLSAIERWPEWNPEVASTSVEGDLQPGTTFRWRSGGSSIVSRLVGLTQGREIGWTGRSMGINVVHVYRLEPRGPATLVRTDESVTGLPVRILRNPIRRRMDAAIQSGLRSLKAEAERRAASS